MFKVIIRYIFAASGIAFVLGFPILILSAIFEIESILNNVEAINILGDVLVSIIYIQTFTIIIIELHAYSAWCNLKRLFICIVGIVIVPLFITYSYNFKKRMGKSLNAFCWYNLSIGEEKSRELTEYNDPQ
jgi:hypothetical protein